MVSTSKAKRVVPESIKAKFTTKGKAVKQAPTAASASTHYSTGPRHNDDEDDGLSSLSVLGIASSKPAQSSNLSALQALTMSLSQPPAVSPALPAKVAKNVDSAHPDINGPKKSEKIVPVSAASKLLESIEKMTAANVAREPRPSKAERRNAMTEVEQKQQKLLSAPVHAISYRTETRQNQAASTNASMQQIFGIAAPTQAAEARPPVAAPIGTPIAAAVQSKSLAKATPAPPTNAADKTAPLPVGATSALAAKAVKPNTPTGAPSQVLAVGSDAVAQPETIKPTTVSSSTSPLAELLHSRLLRTVTEKMKITALTRVQQLCWEPMMLRERDLMIRSETGSGKTLAYGLPLLNRLICDSEVKKIDRTSGTFITVLCPTRELVDQVYSVLSLLVQSAGFLVIGCIHGGDNRHKEKSRIRKGIHVLVATPGRLLDHLKTTSSFDHSRLESLVLDEADRLLDMGFEKPLREIMELIHPQKRVLVSATITTSLERLSHFALRNPLHVGETEDTFAVPASLRQHFCVVQAKHRLTTLISFLRSQLDAGSRKIVVFTSTSDSTEFHYLLLSRLQSPFFRRKRTYVAPTTTDNTLAVRPRNAIRKFQQVANDVEGGRDVVTFDDEELSMMDRGGQETQSTLGDKDAMFNVHLFKLHGNMGQVDRAAVFHNFRSAEDQGVLFCTDVAARGLDMAHIDWIVHYDPPTDERCYIHRVGRTARLGRIGDSVLFLLPHEAGYAEYLSKFIRMPIAEKKCEAFLFYLTKLDPMSNHNWMVSGSTLERKVCQTVREDESVGRVALFAYQSFVRAYAGFPRNVRMYFNQDELHLGHVANSFGIDCKPSELRSKLKMQKVVSEERRFGRDTSRFKRGGEGMEVDSKEVYHGSMVNKQVKQSKDWFEEQREKNKGAPKHLFSEFDAE